MGRNDQTAGSRICTYLISTTAILKPAHSFGCFVPSAAIYSYQGVSRKYILIEICLRPPLIFPPDSLSCRCYQVISKAGYARRRRMTLNETLSSNNQRHLTQLTTHTQHLILERRYAKHKTIQEIPKAF